MSEEYQPFGDEWKKEMSKRKKSVIVDFLAKHMREKKELERRADNFAKNQTRENLSILESFLMEMNLYD